jgi:hypothetical protein
MKTLSLSYATNIEVNISNIKPITGKLFVTLDTKDTYDKAPLTIKLASLKVGLPKLPTTLFENP